MTETEQFKFGNLGTYFALFKQATELLGDFGELRDLYKDGDNQAAIAKLQSMIRKAVELWKLFKSMDDADKQSIVSMLARATGNADDAKAVLEAFKA